MTFFSYLGLFLLVVVGFLMLTSCVDFKSNFDVLDANKIVTEDIESYVKKSEEKFTDIIPGTEKNILWFKDKNSKTELSIIYLHGFSATRQEVSPLTENIAKHFKANLFLTRLTGHGRSGDAMAEITVEKLLSDTLEAFEIGKLIGKRVIVIGMSTGATLATWLAVKQQIDELAGVILLSPNYGLIDPKANWLLKPGAKVWLPIVEGSTYQFEPDNKLQAKYWTWRYPTVSLIPMMKLVDYVLNLSVQKISAPTLVLYSDADSLVDTKKIQQLYAQFGSKIKEIDRISGAQGSQHHVLAGDILSPKTTEIVQSKVTSFIEQNILKKE